MRNTALLGLLFFSWSIICLTEGVKMMEMFRRRRQACEHGTYKYEGRDCCLCPRGYHVTKHCTTTGTDGNCKVCDTGYYRDQPNDKENCEPCAVCQINANLMVERECSAYQNSICTCVKDHYCDKGENCKVCHLCDTCKDSSVKLACTATNNTVCNEKEEGSITAVVASVTAVVLVAAVAACMFYLWKKKKIFFTDQQPASSPEENEVLRDDVDLEPVLSDIAQIFSWQVVKDVVEPSVTPVERENIERNNPNNSEEQKVQLLRTWYQKQGIKGAYTELVKKLYKKKHRTQASQVESIVDEHLKNAAK